MIAKVWPLREPPLAIVDKNRIMRRSIAKREGNMVALSGPLATVCHKPRQARKGATVVVKVCAGVWLVRAPSINVHPLASPSRLTDDFRRLHGLRSNPAALALYSRPMLIKRASNE